MTTVGSAFALKHHHSLPTGPIPDSKNEDLYGLSGASMATLAGGMIMSDGKAIRKKPWGRSQAPSKGGG